jgi:hypothetical protein
MPAGADVFRRAGPAERARCGAGLRPSPRRARDDLVHGRTEAFGGHLWPCDPGGHAHAVDHAGRPRRCPRCQRRDTAAWLAERRQARRPVSSVHVVFTVPQERGEIIRRPQQDLDASLCRAASPSLITLAADPQEVGGLIGVLGVRQTGTRTLVDHPHGPGLVPAGGIAADRSAWRPARSSSRVPVHALSKLLRGLLRDG